MPRKSWVVHFLWLVHLLLVDGRLSHVGPTTGANAISVLCQARLADRQLAVRSPSGGSIGRKPGPLALFASALRLSLRQGLSGGAAGLVQVITMMWLRTTVTYQYRYGVSTFDALRELYAQGGIPRFYRGLAYAIVQAPLCRFGSVAANEISNILVGVPTSSDAPQTSRSPAPATTSVSTTKIVLAATLGSLLSTIWRIILMPLDTCKTVLQVDGTAGFNVLMARVLSGDLSPLFRGTAATIVATWVGHSWFLVHNWLDAAIAVPESSNGRVLRAAWIGFLASAISDATSNFIKVIKTVKQSMLVDVNGESPSYSMVVNEVLAQGGLAGLFGRGLTTRVVSNGVQSVVFTVLWKVVFKRNVKPLASVQARKRKG